MQGTILILDGVSTNRIMLKVQLSAAYYHVVQSDGIRDLLALARRTQPNLIVTAMTLPDGSAMDVRALLQQDEILRHVPIIAVTSQNDRTARLDALRAGIDDVLSQPLDDVILQARIRSLLRVRNSAEDLHLRDASPSILGFAEPMSTFTPAARVALLTQDAATGALWRARLKGQVPDHLQAHQLGDIHQLMADPVPDAFVIDLTGPRPDTGLRLMADLHARSTTSKAALIAVVPPNAPARVADALDRGAHDVLQSGFCADELSLRLKAQLHRKACSDQLRNSVRDGLRAAVRDPMTGLHNRRFAIPHLASVSQGARQSGGSFAVMLADLDHFKQINDTFGHQVGDAVLTELARRMKALFRPQDMIARIGGEEFLIVLPEADQTTAAQAADRLCRNINSEPFHCPGLATPIHVTVSIGVALGPAPQNASPMTSQQQAMALIDQADRALYAAKGNGRNTVSVVPAAA